MTNAFKDALWIWCNADPKEDEYGEFIDTFDRQSGKTVLRISADSNYAAYINGSPVAFGQYADYPYDKIYDEIDITAACRDGENRLAVIVWYYGTDTTQVYYPGNAGLIYEVCSGDRVLCKSGRNSLSRLSRAYKSHTRRLITEQLGFSFSYDASREDGWMTGDCEGFAPSAVVNQVLPLRIRPVERLTPQPAVIGSECRKISDTDVIYDLGGEQVGVLSLSFFSPCEQDITVAYGEHLADGCVRQNIGDRNFSVSFRSAAGDNKFVNLLRRLGCRYLELRSEQPLVDVEAALIPCVYKVCEKGRPPLDGIKNKIYDMCVKTLRSCMHEHYEDCPWREQALYTMDSRNQMLCGYYAFGEYAFPRANLQLISEDRRDDGLLSICFPTKRDLVIPSFTLHFITACKEYLEYSGDKEFIEKIYPKAVSCIKAFRDNMKDGLAIPFRGKCYWNFYEWRPGLDGSDNADGSPDLILNALLSLALRDLAAISDALGKKNDYLSESKGLSDRIREVFFSEKDGLFFDRPDGSSYSQLGNSLAVLCGAAVGDEAAICRRLLHDRGMTPISLSMKCFMYDALLKTDRKEYGAAILADIENTYRPMAESGSDTVWETESGESDFDGAGSLCHGWSAMPIYYYHILLSGDRTGS